MLTLSYAENDVILMDDFSPTEFTGTWYVLQRTDRIYNDTASCIKIDIKHTDGQIYEIRAQYKGPEGQKREKTLTIVDDADHPAQFYFVDDDQRNIAMSVLGTDYKNWGFCYGYMTEGAKTYGVVSRQMELPPDCVDEMKSVVDKNGVVLPFSAVPQDNC
ncbi:uncharacterized protein LOC135393255 [Ornithodoros turicata]|uniref:uncharacterized protein LOC135393255 n=1 Tax=Ornithodoros turicata TaxID=34597 RepID=UPI0031399BD9